MKASFFFAILLVFAISSVCFSATINVPKDQPSIQEGINMAINGDTVLVAPGTYVENIIFKTKAITVKSKSGAGVTIIDGGSPMYPDFGSVVTFNGKEGSNSVLEGFTITNGSGTISGYFTYGGGVYCSNFSSPTLSNCIFTGNSVTGNGGGMCNIEISSPTLTNCTFTGNFTTGNICDGGGMYNHGSSPTLTDCTFTGNSAASNGGGICNLYSSSPILTNCNFSGNSGKKDGGGMYNQSSSPILTNCIFSENSVTGSISDGGGMYNQFSSPTLTNCTFTGNSAKRYGGGICNYNHSSPKVTNCTFMGNSAASNGGGICNLKTSSPRVTNCTFSGNSGKISGGGMYNSSSSPTLTNCILWGDTPDEVANIVSSANVKYSCIQGGYVGKGNIQTDPLFIAGPKGFLYLSQIAAGQPVDSPCIDSGSDFASNLGMDFYWTRTDEMPDSGTVDMGYHYGPFTYPSLQVDTFSISESAGGSSNFLLLGENINANKNYLIFGSVTGTSPGITFPISNVNLPINWDIFTNIVICFANQPMFNKFLGQLDGEGKNSAKLVLPPNCGGVGITMYFAYALVDSLGTWDFASNPVEIEIVF